MQMPRCRIWRANSPDQTSVAGLMTFVCRPFDQPRFGIYRDLQRHKRTCPTRRPDVTAFPAAERASSAFRPAIGVRCTYSRARWDRARARACTWIFYTNIAFRSDFFSSFSLSSRFFRGRRLARFSCSIVVSWSKSVGTELARWEILLLPNCSLTRRSVILVRKLISAGLFLFPFGRLNI